MGNPSDERTTINVKGMSVSSWERAKKSAAKQDESMGAWLTRAVEQLANLEDGPREFPPMPPANPAPESGNPPALAASGAPVEGLGLGQLMQGMAALAAATGTPPARSDTRRLYALVDDQVRQARGMPPRPVRRRQGGLAAGQSLLENGKADPV